MGQWSSTELEMKSLLLVFATLCSAAPDADPAFAYSVGLPYTYLHAPYYVVPYAGCRNNLGAVVPCNGAVPLVAAAAPAEAAPEVEAVDRKKRDADADADADPAVLLTRSYISHPLTYYHYPYSYGLPYVYGRKKRDADADATADADPLLYYSYPYTYAAYTPYAYTYVHPYAGCRNNQGALVPCA